MVFSWLALGLINILLDEIFIVNFYQLHLEILSPLIMIFWADHINP